MKLYTEEQIFKYLLEYGTIDLDSFILDLTPIELPSDEEVEKWAFEKYHEVEDSRWFEPLQIGAKWIRDKLTNTKEK